MASLNPRVPGEGRHRVRQGGQSLRGAPASGQEGMESRCCGREPAEEGRVCGVNEALVTELHQ